MQRGWEEQYYLNQAGTGFSPYAGIRFQRGSGFTPYSGYRYQKGHGFLGRVWKGVTLPLLKYIGRHGLEAAGNIIKEVSSSPDDVKSIVAKEARRVAGKAIEDGGKRLSTYVQTGQGVKTRIPPGKTNKARNVSRSNPVSISSKPAKTNKAIANSKKNTSIGINKATRGKKTAKPQQKTAKISVRKTKTAKKCPVKKTSQKSFLSLV